MGYSSTFAPFAVLFSLLLGFIGALLIFFVTYEDDTKT
jgi:multidrug efflux pump subunit AcrB